MIGIEYSFQKLNVWHEAKKLVVDVYNLLDSFPKFEKYALCDHIRRAIVSVPSNIAEGSGRRYLKEKIHFLEISYGSLMEVSSQFEIAEELGYITANDRLSMDILIEEVARLLSGLQKSFKLSTDSTDSKL